MSESSNGPDQESNGRGEGHDDHAKPEAGLIPDEDLPEDLQPTDDNPLAKDPDPESEEPGPVDPSAKADPRPDMGSPG